MKGIIKYYKKRDIIYDVEIENCKLLMEELRDSIIDSDKVDSILLYTHLFTKLHSLKLKYIANTNTELKTLLSNLDYLGDFYCNIEHSYDLYFYLTDYNLTEILVDKGDRYLKQYIQDILKERGEVDE